MFLALVSVCLESVLIVAARMKLLGNSFPSQPAPFPKSLVRSYGILQLSFGMYQLRLVPCVNAVDSLLDAQPHRTHTWVSLFPLAITSGTVWPTEVSRASKGMPLVHSRFSLFLLVVVGTTLTLPSRGKTLPTSPSKN